LIRHRQSRTLGDAPGSAFLAAAGCPAVLSCVPGTPTRRHMAPPVAARRRSKGRHDGALTSLRCLERRRRAPTRVDKVQDRWSECPRSAAAGPRGARARVAGSPEPPPRPQWVIRAPRQPSSALAEESSSLPSRRPCHRRQGAEWAGERRRASDMTSPARQCHPTRLAAFCRGRNPPRTVPSRQSGPPGRCPSKVEGEVSASRRRAGIRRYEPTLLTSCPSACHSAIVRRPDWSWYMKDHGPEYVLSENRLFWSFVIATSMTSPR